MPTYQICFIFQSSEDAEFMLRRYTMSYTNPHLIMYIFLPILIFDSSFKMEAHSVFKAIGQVLCMALAGLVVTMLIIGGKCWFFVELSIILNLNCLTLGFMYVLMNYAQGLSSWNIPICLLFGSILSATDPVAVVSLLRELGLKVCTWSSVSKVKISGAPHQVVVLIESESLFNDGTAIIAYGVLLKLSEHQYLPTEESNQCNTLL